MASFYTKFLLQFAVNVILARLLMVAEFGLMTQALVVANFASVIAEIGMAPALVQKRGLLRGHVRLAFYVSVISGLALGAMLWLAAPLVAGFYVDDAVTPVLRTLCFSFLLSSLATVSCALLQRKMDFRSLFIVDTGAYFTYGVFGVTLALRGYGVWSLVYATLAQFTVQLCLAGWFARQALPEADAGKFSGGRELLRFGAGLTATRLLLHFARNADNLMVGRFRSAADMGLYSRAYALMTLPIMDVAGAMNAVLFPAYSEIQDDTARLRRVYLQNLTVVTARLFPILVAMSAVAPEIMVGVYGKQWEPAAGPLRVLCFGGFFLAVHNLGDALARAKGAIAARFWRHAVYGSGVLLLAAWGAHYGITAVAYGVTAALCLQYLLMAQLANQLLQSTWREFFSAQFPGLLLAGFSWTGASSAAWLLRQTSCPVILTAALAPICGIGLAGVVLLLLPSRWLPPAVNDLVAQVRRRGSRALGPGRPAPD